MREGKTPFKARAALAALLLLLGACSDFDLYSVMQGEIPGGPLVILPVSVLLYTGDTCRFSASGGSPPYSFSVVPQTGCGSIETGTGLYTAPAGPINDVIQVQDSTGATSQATATVLSR